MHPKREGQLDLLDVVRQNLDGWRLEEVYSFGFGRGLRRLCADSSDIVRQAQTFIHGDHQPYVVCFKEDVYAIRLLRHVEERFHKVAQPIRDDLFYVNRNEELAVAIGGADIRKINSDNREEVCPRVGRVLTTEAYDDIISQDPCAFLRAIMYNVPPEFSV